MTLRSCGLKAPQPETTDETGGDHKVEDLAKAGRDDMNTDEGAE
jgi:hypothetical protein